MISYIKGEVINKGIDFLIVENNGIGYHVNTSLNTLNSVTEGETVSIYTYMHVREDVLALYGFSKNEELDMFKKLISVNGVGPKAGLAVLSTYEINKIKLAISREDVTAISKVPGLGKKTAGKIILELKDKIGSINTEDLDINEEIKIISNETNDIINVLLTLGFTQLEAKNVLEDINVDGKTENQIIKEALRLLNR